MSDKATWYIGALYHFAPIKNPPELAMELRTLAELHQIHGILVIAPEGINTTSAAPNRGALEAWIDHLASILGERPTVKYSKADFPPFKRMAIKVRPEICTTGHPDLQVDNGINHHLEPQEWDAMAESGEAVIIDTRNDYEYQLGTFKGAINPQTRTFGDFFDQVDQMNLPKDKPLMIFCTGGIRCHKGITELQRRGYNNVWQLNGGILRYLQERPHQNFIGDCFVFDHRIAVGQDLAPAPALGLCPHCGDPAKLRHDCKRCGTEAWICHSCQEQELLADTCSKDCAYHWKQRPGRKLKTRRSKAVAPKQ